MCFDRYKCLDEPIVYSGRSMFPVLLDGDMLRIIPYIGHSVQVGDVVVFRRSGGKCNVVHRVISIDSQGQIRTKGDYSRLADAGTILIDNILGRVAIAYRAGTSVRIWRGITGQFVATVQGIIFAVIRSLAFGLKPFYNSAVNKALLWRVLYVTSLVRVLRFRQPGGSYLKFMIGRWAIAKCSQGEDLWQIRFPFPAFVAGFPHYWDAALGIDTEVRRARLGKLRSNLLSGGEVCVPCRYLRIIEICDYLNLSEEDVFIDLGCGKGRVVCYVMATHHIRKAIGVEVDPELAEMARRNCTGLRIAKTSAVEILCQDVIAYQPSDETVYFLYNMFDERTLRTVVKKIRLSLDIYPRHIRIVSFACVGRHVFDTTEWLEEANSILRDDILVWQNNI